ncbi:MAG: RimK family alpha-L-glutamate ligase [Caulobacterales bacterium]
MSVSNKLGHEKEILLSVAYVPDSQSQPAAPRSLGVAALAGMVFAGQDLEPLWADLMARATASPADIGAMLDLSTILQLVGRREEGLALQADALAHSRLFRTIHGTGAGPSILTMVTPGDMMANTPVDFLLKGSDAVVVHSLFLEAGRPSGAALPEHDLAILAVGESDANAQLLRALATPLSGWPRPVLNGHAERVLALGRDRLPGVLEGAPGLMTPATRRVNRHAVAELSDLDFPVLARPVDSHAGNRLEKLDSPADLARYLAAEPADHVYLTAFVDYRGADGLFRKVRVAMIDGRPFISHMAISEHWMVHYLNAGMAEKRAKRDEEAAMMASFDTSFAVRHADAFAALHERIGLDYFALDCGQTQDGRLLIFEADTAMIVHDMDPPDLYPYKGPAMRKLFAAFQAMVVRRTGLA